MQTATIEVKYVNPPKPGKQYGSIKDINGDTWPVKVDRIGEFDTGHKYELGFSVTESGFRNIASVKRLDEPQLRGDYTRVPAQPRNGATLMARNEPQRQAQPEQSPQSTKATQQESIFVCGGLYRDIEMGRVGTSENDLVERAILWRNVFRRAFPE